VIKVHDDYFIANRGILKTLMSDIINKKTIIPIIDASASLKDPIIMESENIIDISQYIYEVLKKDDDLITLQVKSNWCIPTLTGLLLGYPTVYWINNMDNCLSGVSLCVYKVQGEYLKFNKLHVLTSFSVPRILEVKIKSYIKKWFIDLKSNSQISFVNLKLITELVVQTNIVI
jgi:hypothetical protein